MFAMEKPSPAPRKSAAPKVETLEDQRKVVAEVSGAIAGMPKGFQDAGEALRDVVERCQRANASTGILRTEQAMLVKSVGVDCRRMMGEITALWKMVDALIEVGVWKPKVERLF